MCTFGFCVQPFPSMKLFDIGSTLSAFISGFLIYIPNFPSLCELGRANLRPLLLIFPHLLSADVLEAASPKINTTGGLGLGWAGARLRLACFPSATALRPSLTFNSCYIHMLFNTQIHKYTNTQMLCCNVNFYIVFVSLSCISYLY